MKLLTCVLLMSGLLYANAATLRTITTRCKFGLRTNCPKGTTQVWHGKNSLNSACFCERFETWEEAQKRRESERPARCQIALDQCKKFDSRYANGSIAAKGCNTALNECDPIEDLEDFCAYLKRYHTKWQCEKAALDYIEEQKKEKARRI